MALPPTRPNLSTSPHPLCLSERFVESFIGIVQQWLVALAVAIGKEFILGSIGKAFRQSSHLFRTVAVGRGETPCYGAMHNFYLRAEDAGKNSKHREKYDLVTARAVARLSVLAEYCLPLVKKGGRFIALKGSKYAEEIEEGTEAVQILGGKIISAEPVKLPGLDDGRAIIKIGKTKTTPAQYPRKAGTPEKQPLGSK